MCGQYVSNPSYNKLNCFFLKLTENENWTFDISVLAVEGRGTTGREVTEACFTQTDVRVAFSGGKTVQKFFKLIYLLISCLSLLHLGFGSAPVVSKSMALHQSLLLSLSWQQRVYSVRRSCCGVEEWEEGKTAIKACSIWAISSFSSALLEL